MTPGRPAAPRARVLALGVICLAGPAACAERGKGRVPGPVAGGIIAVTAELGAEPVALVDAWHEIDRLVERVRGRARDRGVDAVEAMRAVLFDELKFAREVDDQDPRYFSLPSVLSQRRGSCLGLGAVYLAVAEGAGIPLDGVRVPGHFFVRTRESTPRNIELLRGGEIMPDSWYRQKYGPWPEDRGGYFRPLSVAEVSAVFWFNAGNHARSANQPAVALRAYERAVRADPGFAEAAASLGAVRQLVGALPEAEQAYQAAARARAELPGLEHNVALLRQQEKQEKPEPVQPPASPHVLARPDGTPHRRPQP